MKNKKEEILKMIQPVFCKVFNNKNLKINYNSSPVTINKWDSLAQINLIIGIENLFLSVRGVFIKPGLTRDILTLYLLKSK